MGIIYDVFLKIEVDVEKNNLAICVYGVFGLVSYPNNSIEVAFFVFVLGLCLNAVIEGEVFCFFR